MSSKKILSFFEDFLEKETLFKNKKILQSTYTPEEIPHREEQLDLIANILAPALKKEKPSNLFLYGKTGTGKTLSVTYVTNQMQDLAEQKKIPLKIIYINCKLKKVVDTEYRLIAEISKKFGKLIPPTGLPTDEVYNIFFEALDAEEQNVLLILDEIDQLVKKSGDEIIYNLTRINADLKNAQLSIIGISNNLSFANNLDPRVKSSLSEEELVFPPYNAIQLKDILKKRSNEAFKEGTVETGVIEKCSAFAARDHGDARRALELLRVAGELAERENSEQIKINHLDNAEEKLERDKVIDIVETQPKQFQIVLYSIILLNELNKVIITGKVYENYRSLCEKIELRPITQRRVSDIISEFDMLGILTVDVVSKGRYGRTRNINLAINPDLLERIKQILDVSLGFSRKNDKTRTD